MPFLFKNKENSKWISFENNSSSYDNRDITLTECKECDNNTVPAGMPDSDSGTYMIKLDNGGDCLFPNESDKLISGNCNTILNSHIYEMKQLSPGYLEQALPEQLRVSITFNDNYSANINSNTYNWGGRLTKKSHKYNSLSDSTKTKLYDILKGPKLYSGNKIIKNPTLKNFLTENISVRCKLFHVIEEYDSAGKFIKKTIYRLKYIHKSDIGDITDDSIAGILTYNNSNEKELLNTSLESDDVVISYLGKRNYGRSNIDDINMKNFSNAHIGTILSGKHNHGYINTNKYMGGIIINSIENKRTNFRVIPNDSIFNRMINYSYPEQTTGDSSENIGVNMSSFVNPNKKVFVKNNSVVSKNLRDESQNEGGVFNVIPVSESFSTYEGYSDNYSIKDEIQTLNNMLNSPTSFKAITSHIDSILKMMNKSNAESDYAHTVKVYKRDLININYCFVVAETLYQNLSSLYQNMMSNYLKIGLNNVYGNSVDGTEVEFDDTIANSVMNQMNTLKNEINSTKSYFSKDYNLSLIEIDETVIIFLINLFKYFNANYNVINGHVNAFFDYNDAINKIDYCKSYSFLNQVKFDDSSQLFDYDSLLNLSNYTLKDRINHAESFNNKSKIFFDLDFSQIYNQLFVDAINGPRSFDNVRIEKILHKDDRIVSQFINSGQNRGIMHYYHDLLVSQKAYLESFNKFRSRYNDIQYFKTNLPNSNIPHTIFNFYVSYGKKLDTGNSYFFTLMNYYSNLSMSTSTSDTTKQARFFLALFKNMRYYDEQGVLFPTLDYSSINTDNLYKYYESNYFIDKKSEPTIIRAFMNKSEYNQLANAIQASVGDLDGIISINDSTLKVNENTLNIENFTSMNMNSKSGEYHPAKPTIIASSSPNDYDINLFGDAFWYDAGSGSGATDLKTYLDTEYDGGDFDGTKKKAVCRNTNGSSTVPNIKMEYSCGTEKKKYDKYINDFFSNGGASCKSSTRRFDYSIRMNYKNYTNGKNACAVSLRLHDNKGISKGGYIMDVKVPHTDFLEAFDTSNGVISLETTYNGPGSNENKMTYLEDIYPEEPSSASSVLYNAAPGEIDRYFRLYIQNGKLQLDYKLARGVAIDNSKDKYGFKGVVDPTVPYSGNNKVIYLYKTDKTVGEHLNKNVYVDSAGVAHNIESDKMNTTITQSGTGTDNSVYTQYDDYCYSKPLTSSNNTPNDDSIAKFNGYYLNKNELNYVYPTDGTCVDGTTSASLQLKNNEFNADYGACVTDPSDVNMIDIEKYKNLSSVSNEFSEDKCDKKHVFNGAVTKFKQARNDFRAVFANMIDKFNSLNENEIEMLNGTQESIENLKETIKEYNHLYKKATENENKNRILDAQTKDTKIVLEKTQYGMALMGIGAIGITMLMFNYMKK